MFNSAEKTQDSGAQSNKYVKVLSPVQPTTEWIFSAEKERYLSETAASEEDYLIYKYHIPQQRGQWSKYAK